MNDDAILEMARDAAAGLGESSPTDIEYVRSASYFEAVRVIAGDIITGGGDITTVITIQLHGTFHASSPALEDLFRQYGREPASNTGTVLKFIINEAEGTTLGISVDNEPADLSLLGTTCRLT